MSAGDPLTMETISKLKILIVDDAEEVRHDLRTILRLTPDLEVLGEAVNGVEALALAEELRPDIVLMDLRLPGLDGLEATQQIKRNGLAKGVVVLSIYAQEENRARAASAGADAFVEKGTGVETLLATIRQVGESCRLMAGGSEGGAQKVQGPDAIG